MHLHKRSGLGVGVCAHTSVPPPVSAHPCVPARLSARGRRSARKRSVGREYFVLSTDCMIKREE